MYDKPATLAKHRTWRRKVQKILTISLVPVLVTVVLLSGGAGEEYGSKVDSDGASVHNAAGRKLLALPLANCSPAAIENFPSPGLNLSQRRHGGVILYVLVAVYMFWGLAIACDEYFVPACEKLCDVLNLQSDVAGATFMAAGSSAPELATALVGVFIAEDDIALGAVVGSAVFNILFVISFCALFAGSVIYLSWFPMFRDCIFYAISILALVFSIYDGEIQWYEALMLMFLYVMYILFMCINQRVENFIVPKFTSCDAKARLLSEDGEKQEVKKYMDADSESESGVFDAITETHTLLTSELDTQNMQLQSTGKKLLESTLEEISDKKKHEEEEEYSLAPPSGCCARVWWALSLPMTSLMYITTPDVRKQRWTSWWLVTFLVSCAWIGLFSYIMVWMITIVGQTLGVPDTVMGITFIAAGASIPDVIASFLVLKDGYGDMAVSNAIGSNIFDILICMGVPYFVRAITYGGAVEVYSHGLLYSSILLFSTVILLLVSLHLNSWRLTRIYGILLMVFYLAITTIAVLFELNVFGNVRPPTCPSTV